MNHTLTSWHQNTTLLETQLCETILVFHTDIGTNNEFDLSTIYQNLINGIHSVPAMLN